MPLDTAIALFGFAFVMSISPGPGNFLLLASGANFGFARSLPLIFGISAGFLSMVLGVGLGLGEVLQAFPEVYTVLKVLCGAYILWLAWKIANSRSLGSEETDTLPTPITFIQACLLQLLNPKAWTVALIVTVTYTSPGNYISGLFILIGLFAMVNLPAISTWALAGASLQNFLNQGKRIIWFNIAMALLLITCMVPMLLQT